MSISYLEKADKCLKTAQAVFAIHENNEAGRGEYLAAFHVAQAFIFERTGKIAKTHAGVHTEFDRLTLDAPELKKLPTFLRRAYALKATADYETGAHSDVMPGHANEAIQHARAFIHLIRHALEIA